MSDAAQLISDEAGRLYDAMHGLIPRLVPLSLDTLGLADTLENLVRDWQRRYPAVQLSARNDVSAVLGPTVTLTIYRVAQEGLINALRHAQATQVQIELHSDDGQIMLTVTDDGVGLPPDWSRPGHFGLRGSGRARGASGRLLYRCEQSAAWRAPDRQDSPDGGSMIKVLLADDHAVVRTGFRLLLQSQPDINVVAEAQSGEAACQMFAELSPDVVVMDLGMPGMGGLEAMRRIRARNPAARVLALSAHDDPMHARRALREGALGFLSKRSAPEALIEAISAIAAGRRYIDPGLAQKLALAEIEGAARSPIEQLSEREFEVFIRLAGGATVQKIADDLKLSASTIGTHLYNIKQKLGVVNQSELTLLAIRHGLIEA